MSDQAVHIDDTPDVPEKTTSGQATPAVELSEVPISRPKYLYSFFILYCLFVLDFAARLGVLSVFPTMQAELKFTDAQLGLIGSAVLMGMSLFVLPLAYIADKTSKKRAITAMSVLWGVGSAMCGMVSNFFVILLGRLMVGMGNASYAPVSVSLLTSWTPKSRWGSVIGTYNSAMAVGMAVGTMVSGLLAGMYGWRVPFLIFGALTVAFAALAMTLPREARKKESGTAKKANIREAFSVTLKNRTLVLVGIGGGLCNLAFASLMAWVPMYLVRTQGWNSAEVGGILGPVYLITGICIAPLSGVVSDKLAKIDNRNRAWIGTPVFLLSALLFVVAFKAGWFVLIALCILLANLPIAGLHIITQEVVPARYRASAYGTYVVFLQGLGFFGPLLVGGLSEMLGLTQALIFMQGAFVLAAMALLVAGFTYRSDFAKARALDNN